MVLGGARPWSRYGGRSAEDLRHHRGPRAPPGATASVRHTYGTELAAAGIDLLALRDLMGHASPETTAGYVHLSAEHLAAEYAAAQVTSASSSSSRTNR